MSVTVTGRSADVDATRHTPGWLGVLDREPVGIAVLFPPAVDEPGRPVPPPADEPGAEPAVITAREVAVAREELDGFAAAQLPHAVIGGLTHRIKGLLAEYPADPRVRQAMALVEAYDALESEHFAAQHVIPADEDTAQFCGMVTYAAQRLGVAR